ncbi:unnamed protein product [Diatraea saccharalis]|uniref:Fatty acyl-CoA reductase n=1 Tax=Diatraea saccharalis TaxID=40085 RepID=A0A9N9WJQ6_9NEOP|nr:unnamed protein product [Diatraea saccharalis]
MFAAADNTATMASSVSVKEYYAGKSIFITGSTGFMGKVLVEKILRCCPDVKNLYLLMRAKKGHGSKERIDEFLNCRIFDFIKNEQPEQLQKLQVVPGDILVEDMGMAMSDRAMLQNECQIVFHCAACVRFDMFIRDALNLNTVGTQRVLDLVFVHVSTAYNHCELDVLEEKLYPSKHKPQHVLDCASWMDDEMLEYLQPKLIQPQPNTYAYTKSLTEDLVSQYAGKFPIVIARPSIVTSSYKEPMPGWVDNLNGPTGLMVGAGKGLEKPKELQVCNLTLSEDNPLTWGAALDMGRYHVKEFPFSVCLWYPGGSPKTSWLQHQIALFFTHLLPADYIKGAREYCLKEDPLTLPQARRLHWQ